jgi:hypothetical protein
MGWYVEYQRAKAEQELQMQNPKPQCLGEAISSALMEIDTKHLESQISKALCIEGHVRDLFTRMFETLRSTRACEEFLDEYERVFNRGGKYG